MLCKSFKMKLYWSVLLSLVFVGLAAAGPHALQGQLSRFLGEELSQVQHTQCQAIAHKVIIHLGGKSYEYKYRLCTNRISQNKCVDSTQSLPLYCPFFDDLTDCVKIEWYVGRQKTVFEICDDWGVPCQKQTSSFRRTNVFGDCKYHAGIQGVTLCEEKPDGTSDCTGTAAIMTSNEADNSESDEDCFCVRPKNGEQTCKGNCRTTK